MKIMTTLIRAGGSIHQVGDKSYHFAPNAKDDHVAEVTEASHIKRFLSIDGFEPYDENAKQADPTKDAPPVTARQAEPATVEPIKAEPMKEPEQPADEGQDAAAAPQKLEDATDDELKAIYEECYDKAPHHKFSRDKIISMIRTALAKQQE